uniref:Uncharacterized protein n=1 Tax=Physcomitrium patens TaxID=3218 RepID=A0A2K1IQT3_PHYPA|nr:hypothetical protein PHYPA_025753 [Physcomitrium patens]
MCDGWLCAALRHRKGGGMVTASEKSEFSKLGDLVNGVRITARARHLFLEVRNTKYTKS